MKRKNSIQPLIKSKNGTLRFKENKIVSYLLDNGGIDMNHLAVMDFSNDDREQFAQLIGYSLSGYADLRYVSDNTYGTASKMSDGIDDEKDARIAYMEDKIQNVRSLCSKLAGEVFEIHPDDLTYYEENSE